MPRMAKGHTPRKKQREKGPSEIIIGDYGRGIMSQNFIICHVSLTSSTCL